MRSHYEVIVIGAELPALFAGALLAKRGYRVLVIQHDTLEEAYSVGELRLPRNPWFFVAAETPIAKRILNELALHTSIKQYSNASKPLLQFAIPSHRFDVPGDEEGWRREIEREFPEIASAIEGWFSPESPTFLLFEEVLSGKWPIPPLNCLERHRLQRAVEGLIRQAEAEDPLRSIPEDHPFRAVLRLPLRFFDGIDPDHAPPCLLYT
ncbi:MAG: hypothetical protein N2515_06595, partial [Deltaproteobacteria bacterium]|nr:hypothetical protein [Deltaproteobacteria bacterium]